MKHKYKDIKNLHSQYDCDLKAQQTAAYIEELHELLGDIFNAMNASFVAMNNYAAGPKIEKHSEEDPVEALMTVYAAMASVQGPVKLLMVELYPDQFPDVCKDGKEHEFVDGQNEVVTGNVAVCVKCHRVLMGDQAVEALK